MLTRTQIGRLAQALRPYVADSTGQRGQTAVALDIARNIAQVIALTELAPSEAVRHVVTRVHRDNVWTVDDLESAIGNGAAALAGGTKEDP